MLEPGGARLDKALALPGCQPAQLLVLGTAHARRVKEVPRRDVFLAERLEVSKVSGFWNILWCWLRGVGSSH